MRKFTLLTSVLLTAPFSASNISAQCVASQDCASLGYTETSCESGGIKCPFGNAWACSPASRCTYGSIYYSDGTCLRVYDSSKTPIGVVAYDENGEKWIIALENASSGEVWSTEKIDVPEIENYTTTETVINDMKSCENTEAMLALGAKKYPVAATAKNYAPAGAENTKGKWCLPAAGIWYIVNNHRPEIDAAMSLAKGLLFDSSSSLFHEHWSSSEYSNSSAWTWNAKSKELSTYPKSNYNTYYYVRPVMKI